jgi:hypothetical protein
VCLSTTEVREAGKIVVKVLKGAASSVKADELKKVVCKAKFEAARRLETREGVVGAAIAQVCAVLGFFVL